MKKLILISILATFFVPLVYAGLGNDHEQFNGSQVIYSGDSQKSFKGQEEWFAGDVPLSSKMRKLLTGYVINYNRRYKKSCRQTLCYIFVYSIPLMI